MSAPRQAWDYKILMFVTASIDLADTRGPALYEDGKQVPVPRDTTNMLPRIKELGDDGWELVTVSQVPGTEGRWQFRYYFKRPK